jgi:hypothetical protein
MSAASIPSVLLEADAHFVATYPVNRLPRDFPAGILRLSVNAVYRPSMHGG